MSITRELVMYVMCLIAGESESARNLCGLLYGDVFSVCGLLLAPVSG